MEDRCLTMKQNNKHELSGLSKYETFTRVLKKSPGRRETIPVRWIKYHATIQELAYERHVLVLKQSAKTRLFGMFNDNIKPEFNVHRDFLKRWQKPGDEKSTNIPSLMSYGSAAYYRYYTHYSNLFDDIQPFASDPTDNAVIIRMHLALKCSEMLHFVSCSSRHILPKIGMSRLALTLSGTNLFTLCFQQIKRSNTHKEDSAKYNYPNVQKLLFGLSVSF